MTKKTGNKNFTFGFWFKFFLIGMFPTHVWTSLMVFNDLEFLAERTSMWDAVGYAGYSYLIALTESVLVALILWGLSFLLPRNWSKRRVLNVVGSIYFVLAGASIVDMAAHVFAQNRIANLYLKGLDRYPMVTYGLITGAILIGIILTLVLIFKSKQGEKIVSEVFERIMLLSYFYLLLDFAGIVIIVLRNVSEKY
jgi:hypothetical protein